MSAVSLGFDFTVIRGPSIQAAPPPWLWESRIARGLVTLFYSIWKVGKSTLMRHMITVGENGGQLAGRQLQPVKILYVSEESEVVWADKARKQPFPDNLRLVISPCRVRTPETWQMFLDCCLEEHRREPFDVLVIDPLSDIFPYADENNAMEVQPIYATVKQLAKELNVGVMLIHHCGKGAQEDYTRSARGSGVHGSAADILIHMAKKSETSTDRRRVLSVSGRIVEPETEILRLSDDGRQYDVVNKVVDPHQLRLETVRSIIADDAAKTGTSRLWTVADLVAAWPAAGLTAAPSERALRRDLEDGPALGELGIERSDGPARLGGIRVGLLADARGQTADAPGQPPTGSRQLAASSQQLPDVNLGSLDGGLAAIDAKLCGQEGFDL